MGFGIDQFISDITSSSAFGAVFSNPIFSALLIMVIILLIIYWVFSEPYNEAAEDLEDSPTFWRLMFRSGVYMMIAIFGIIFIHYKYLISEFENKHEEKLLKQTVQSTLHEGKVQGQGELILPRIDNISTVPQTSGAFDTKPSLITRDDVIIVKGT
jgi:hypothetical protein